MDEDNVLLGQLNRYQLNRKIKERIKNENVTDEYQMYELAMEECGLSSRYTWIPTNSSFDGNENQGSKEETMDESNYVKIEGFILDKENLESCEKGIWWLVGVSKAVDRSKEDITCAWKYNRDSEKNLHKLKELKDTYKKVTKALDEFEAKSLALIGKAIAVNTVEDN